MVDSMKNVAKLDVELTVEERNLLSVGYKNVIGARRASWRILSSIEQKEEAKGNEVNAKRIKEYMHKVESELSSICDDIMTVIDEHLIPSASAGESTVFFYKMYDVIYKRHFLLLIPTYLDFFINYYFLSLGNAGKVIIIDILLSSNLVMRKKRLLIILWKHMRYLISLLLNWFLVTICTY